MNKVISYDEYIFFINHGRCLEYYYWLYQNMENTDELNTEELEEIIQKDEFHEILSKITRKKIKKELVLPKKELYTYRRLQYYIQFFLSELPSCYTLHPMEYVEQV